MDKDSFTLKVEGDSTAPRNNLLVKFVARFAVIQKTDGNKLSFGGKGFLDVFAISVQSQRERIDDKCHALLSVVEHIAQQTVDELHITRTVDEGENAGFQIRELEVLLKQTKVGGKSFRQSGEFVGAGRFQISQFTA